MGFSPGTVGGVEGKWDIPHLMRQDNNLTNTFTGSFKLAPTALLPATWLLYNNNAHDLIFDIMFSTDTPLEVTIKQALGDPGLTHRQILAGLLSGGPSTQTNFEADVAASVGGSLMDGFFAPANQRISILNKAWLANDTGGFIAVSTSLVAANCYCTFYWTEVIT